MSKLATGMLSGASWQSKKTPSLSSQSCAGSPSGSSSVKVAAVAAVAASAGALLIGASGLVRCGVWGPAETKIGTRSAGRIRTPGIATSPGQDWAKGGGKGGIASGEGLVLDRRGVVLEVLAPYVRPTASSVVATKGALCTTRASSITASEADDGSTRASSSPAAEANAGTLGASSNPASEANDGPTDASSITAAEADAGPM